MIGWILFGIAMLFFLFLAIHTIIAMYKDNKILNELDALEKEGEQ